MGTVSSGAKCMDFILKNHISLHPGMKRIANTVVLEVQKVFKGISSTFYIESPLLGLGFAILVAVVNWQMALMGLGAAVISHAVRFSLCRDKVLLQSGLFALNGWFLGLSMVFLFEPSAYLWGTLIPMAVFNAWMTVAAHKLLKAFDLPILVLPYLLAVWMFVLFVQSSGVVTFRDLAVGLVGGEQGVLTGVQSYLIGFGQIFFMENAFAGAGLIALLALFQKPLDTLKVAGVAAFALMFAKLIGVPQWQLSGGLPLFSAALLCQGNLRACLRGNFWVVAVVAVLLSGFLEAVSLRWGSVVGLPGLSLSYILLAWLTQLTAQNEVRTVQHWARL